MMAVLGDFYTENESELEEETSIDFRPNKCFYQSICQLTHNSTNGFHESLSQF